MNVRERFASLASLSNYLVVSSFAVVAALLLRSGAMSATNAAIGAAWVVVANCLFVIAGIFLPALGGTGRDGVFASFVQALVFAGLGFAVACLAWHTGNPLESTPEPIRKFASALRWSDAFWFPLVPWAILSIRGALARRHPTDDGVGQT